MLKRVIIHRKTGQIAATGYFIVITSHNRFIRFTDCLQKKTLTMTMRDFEKRYEFEDRDL